MGRISDEDVQRVRDATDLASVVSETVVLKKKGRLLWGNCPFHQEKTPSFKVDPGTQLWHCFGCSRGGDAFGFVMESERLEFPDAVRRLAERARIEIREEGGGMPSGRKERLVAACEAASEYFHRELTTSTSKGADEARGYLSKRGFGSDVAKRWRLGYAPSARGALVRALSAQGFAREELVEANLALVDGASIKDRFFGRIMFPITDLSGKVIAFGGRVVGSGEPKYLNSQETPIFHKSSNLYGLDRARNDIVTAGTAVVVEGYTDVIALHEAGVRTAVATLGTALTERHVRLLGRFGKRVVYLFDGDAAGRRAAMRAAEFMDSSATIDAGSSQVDLLVALVPDGQDPADYVTAHGQAAMNALIDEARPLMRFVVDERLAEHDLKSPEGKSRALGAAADEVARLWGSAAVREYAQYIAGLLFEDSDVVFRAIERAAKPRLRRAVASAGGGGEESGSIGLRVADKAERELVRLAALYPGVRPGAQDLLKEGAVSDEQARRVLGLIIESGNAVEQQLYAAVATEDRDAANLLTAWLVDAPEVEQVEYAFREVGARLKEMALGRLIFTKKAELRALDPKRDADSYDRLFGEIAELQRAQQALRSGSTANETDMEAE